MKKFAVAAAALMCLGAQAQNIYGGLGVPGVVTLGYALPMGKASGLSGEWGLRGEFAGGISVSKTITEDGNSLTAKLSANRVGAFADWFPADSGFRLVGGLTFNDLKVSLNAAASGDLEVNGKTVSLSGERFNISVKYPTTTPYLGIGWGHRASKEKGLGFYADLGVTVGRFKTTVDTSLVGKSADGGATTITQADVDAQVQDLRDAVNKLTVVPSASIGLIYRF